MAKVARTDIKVICHPGVPYREVLSVAGSNRLPEPFDGEGVYFYLRGSTALWNGLKILRLKLGDTILFPSYHCGIELDVLLKAGFQVEFYRVDETLQIDVADLRRSIRSSTKALYLIHYFGFPLPIDRLKLLSAEYGLVLIEDCAQALYGRFQGKPVGTFGDIAIYSMHKTLPIPCGGVLVVNDKNLPPPDRATDRSLYEAVRDMRPIIERDLVQTKIFDSVIRRFLVPFISSAVGALRRKVSAKRSEPPGESMEFLSDWENIGMSKLSMWFFQRTPHLQVVERRRKNFKFLLDAMSGCRRIRPLIPDLPEGVCPAFFPAVVSGERAVFIEFCQERGVWLVPSYWGGLHPRFTGEPFPESLLLKKNVVIFPVHQSLTVEDRALLKQTVIQWEQSRDAVEMRPVAFQAVV